MDVQKLKDHYAERIRERYDLQDILHNNKTIVMADPSIHSHNELPYIDFVLMNLRDQKEEKKQETEISKTGRLKQLSSLELHQYLTKIAWPRKLYTRPLPRTGAFTHPNRIKSELLSRTAEVKP